MSRIPEHPAEGARAVTPDDDNDISPRPRALWVGGTGNLSLLFWEDSAAVTISNVPEGTLLPFAVKRVLTGTTATSIVALL